MSPSELEKRIVDSLTQGDCGLVELTERSRADGREVLKLLHIMASDKRVRSMLVEGRVLWGLGVNPESSPAPAAKPAPKVETAARVMQKQETKAAPAPAPAPKPEPAKEEPVVAKPVKRKRNQTIIVRQAVLVTELSVTPMNGTDCIICDGEKIEPGAVGEPSSIFVPAKDIPALIEALQQLLEVA